MCNKAKTSWHKNSKRILLLTHQVKDLDFVEFPDEIHYRTVQTFEIERSMDQSFRTKYTAGQSGLLRLSEEFPDEIHYQTVRTLKLSESFQTKNMTRLLKWNEETLPGLPGLRNGHLKKKGMLPEVFYFFL
ncbi:hypothetical protein GLOIN_2v1836687 [Rhizophagus irregularis DAOM 181602=DAOM 197198]|uniref:Uncharacterized protein n=1 Tax=Rhizophagus irregularis (strain DAOM 181602 / DAOM 197198 / MUCL 43194) TaxID=747089 RepID=A0A2P4QM82_RHIID|nr:hypothetical protein GLOIN_2v1836687 [Rhizophagus irregularis DAOM 181602=DAOM 197198]POG78718.1 hypothetical protein GLOIN_2v1836687 [Rhizophagus irregularis DAOM 181602=DAOM 197198]|eukprot:XP_025185584.1 hypothetical protein GLOIN_2v1836687 [Rhizophagus irregularis DAOM 181602=DAOM 197198]